MFYLCDRFDLCVLCGQLFFSRFIMQVNDAAHRMARVIAARTSFAVVPWQMGIVGYVLKRLPNWQYDFAFSKAKLKPRKVK